MFAKQALPEALPVMGARVVPFESYTEALDCIEEAVAARRKILCVAINPEKVYRAMCSRELLAVLNEAEMGICDGIGVALAVRLLHGRWIPRCTGVDLFTRLLSRAVERRWSVFLLGASDRSNAAACSRLAVRYPGLQIAGRHHGYFDASQPVIEQINACGADLLLVAMGSPRQELWIARHRPAIAAPFCMGVGGAFDVISGTVRRAPRFFQGTGTEFLYRLISNPRRLRRQIILPVYVMRVLRRALCGAAGRA